MENIICFIRHVTYFGDKSLKSALKNSLQILKLVVYSHRPLLKNF